ncbi:alpha/beta fold hydrolase [Kribbella sp. NPDC051587]|uniref:alpha/beta fold hydrolase n=1 Tax=Kribbella sp. NPDC051587 TaxID=3364119 RepID=UPI0037AD3044
MTTVAPGDGITMPSVEGVRHRSVTVGGIRFHLAEAGADDAPAVLLLHGFPQHWYAWRGLLTELSDNHRVIAVDLPGFGWSAPSPTGYSTAERARQVMALLDELGIGEVDLVGHDWGAWLAFRIGLDAPRRVRRLVAISEISPWPLQRRLVPRLWRMWVTAIFEVPFLGRVLGANNRVISWFLTRDARNRSIWTDRLVASYADVAARREVATAGQRMHAAFVMRDISALVLRRRWKAPYDVPTLMVAGDNDSYVPAALMEQPRHRADTVRVVTVPGGHFLLDENPSAVSRVVRMHLAD